MFVPAREVPAEVTSNRAAGERSVRPADGYLMFTSPSTTRHRARSRLHEHRVERGHMDPLSKPLDRRSFLRTGVLGATGLAAAGIVGRAPAAWAGERAGFGVLLDRPTVTDGVQAGDVTRGTAVLWGRS